MDGGGGYGQTLVRADVRSCFRAPDVLLARLQRQCEACLSLYVQGPTDNAPGHLPDMRSLARHESEVGTASREGDSERLALPHRDVRARGTPLPGRNQQCQRHWIYACNDQGTLPMCPVAEFVHGFESAEEVRLRYHQRSEVLAFETRQRLWQYGPRLAAIENLNQLDLLVAND